MSPRAQELSYGRFTDVRIYRPPGPARQLALLLSGDGGWGSRLATIARDLSADGTLVAGVDLRDLYATYERDPRACVSPAADLAELSDYLQARYGLAHAAPVLIGHSAGATIAYAALVEAPRGRFAGTLTLSFCVDLDLRKPLCPTAALSYSPRPEGGVHLLPAAALPAPWTALHGLDDTECPASEARAFVNAIPAAHFVGLPGVTHHYWNMDRWWPQFAHAYAELIAAGPPAAAGQ